MRKKEDKRVTVKISDEANDKLKMVKVIMKKRSASDVIVELADKYIYAARGVFNG